MRKNTMLKYTIDDMRALAAENNGKCLSEEYFGMHIKLNWQCSKNHIWQSKPNTIKNGSWCLECSKSKKLTIEKMQEIAFERHGKCLSTEYINCDSKLTWQCSETHIWQATPYKIKKGTWCPYCAGNARLTILDMQKIATQHIGKCLSTVYVNNWSKLNWQCSEAHVWNASANSIKSGTWCPICADTTLTIEEMHKIARLHDGKCLSTQYINNEIKLQWQCSELHVWNANANNIKNGGWCPYCWGNAKLTIQEMKCLAELKNGKCLSEIINGANSVLEWQCSENHIWKATPNNIKRGIWCPYCFGFHKTIEDMRQLAEERGGKCLSEKYIDNKTQLQWQCKKEHVWYASPANIDRGCWCPYCFGRYRTIEDMQKLAYAQDGLCLSIQYQGSNTKLKWQCSKKHIWLATPSSIIHNHSWCPYCNTNHNQECCSKYLEQLFDAKFVMCKPTWLKNPETKCNLQLDGYCVELNLAFEYNGEQHYYAIKFDQNISDEQANIVLINQQKRDKLKIQLCEENNVKLIIIPYWENKNIEKFILSELKRLNINIPNNINK